MQVIFFVNEVEPEMTKKRMTKFGTGNLSACLRRMAPEGTCKNFKVDKDAKKPGTSPFGTADTQPISAKMLKGFGCFPVVDVLLRKAERA